MSQKAVKTKRFLPYGRQSIAAADVRAVTRALRSSFLTQGPAVERFEEAFARKVGAPYAVAVSNGTAALHLAMLAGGVGPKGEVITTPITFVATANAALYAGARPVFADAESETWGADPDHVRRLITSKTRAITWVHYAGQPCRAILEPRPRVPFVVEDACHALGAEVKIDGKWRKVGEPIRSDLAVFSFHPVKHITTGEGGMITVRSRALWQQLKMLRSHGITKDPSQFTRGSEAKNPWYYEMQGLGFNYRMTDLQSALGLEQLKRLDEFVEKRRRIAAEYDRVLAGLPNVGLPKAYPNTRSSWHLYPIRINFKAIGKTRGEVMRALAAKGIGSQVHYIPVPRQPYYEKFAGTRGLKFKTAEDFYQQELSIPMFPDLSVGDVRRVARALRDVLAA